MGDVDYQDMLVEVTGFTPVPEPTTMIARRAAAAPVCGEHLQDFAQKTHGIGFRSQ